MARTRGKDSLGPARRQGGRRRRIVHVFTEGRVTEPTYIEIIRDRGIRADPAVVVEVRIANAGAPGSQRKPVKLVGAAARLMREETRAAKRGGLKKEFWPQVWCLFDRDEHDCVDAALKQAGEAGGGRLLAPLLRGVAAAAPQAGDRHLRRSLRSGRGTPAVRRKHGEHQGRDSGRASRGQLLGGEEARAADERRPRRPCPEVQA